MLASHEHHRGGGQPERLVPKKVMAQPGLGQGRGDPASSARFGAGGGRGSIQKPARTGATQPKPEGLRSAGATGPSSTSSSAGGRWHPTGRGSHWLQAMDPARYEPVNDWPAITHPLSSCTRHRNTRAAFPGHPADARSGRAGHTPRGGALHPSPARHEPPGTDMS